VLGAQTHSDFKHFWNQNRLKGFDWTELKTIFFRGTQNFCRSVFVFSSKIEGCYMNIWMCTAKDCRYDKFFFPCATLLDRLWGIHQASYPTGTVVFPGGKAALCDVDYSLPPGAEVKNCISLWSCCMSSWRSKRQTYLYCYTYLTCRQVSIFREPC
jgi:hypothetical protein